MNTPTQPLTLSEVKQKFDDWRSNRGKLGPFPEEHWRAAVGLLDHYKTAKILRELHITSQQLEDRKMRYQPTQTETRPFVSVELNPPNIKNNDLDGVAPAQPSSSAVATSSIELRRPDGTTLTIHELPRIEVQALVTTFME